MTTLPWSCQREAAAVHAWRCMQNDARRGASHLHDVVIVPVVHRPGVRVVVHEVTLAPAVGLQDALVWRPNPAAPWKPFVRGTPKVHAELIHGGRHVPHRGQPWCDGMMHPLYSSREEHSGWGRGERKYGGGAQRRVGQGRALAGQHVVLADAARTAVELSPPSPS